jgi:uncharacterized surface protein with fasciclin (FAS1) repeats
LSLFVCTFENDSLPVTKIKIADSQALMKNEKTLRKLLFPTVLYGRTTADELSQVKDGDTRLAFYSIVYLTAHHRDGKVYLNNSELVEPDIQASNGVLHGVSGFLTP